MLGRFKVLLTENVSNRSQSYLRTYAFPWLFLTLTLTVFMLIQLF